MKQGRKTTTHSRCPRSSGESDRLVVILRRDVSKLHFKP